MTDLFVAPPITAVKDICEKCLSKWPESRFSGQKLGRIVVRAKATQGMWNPKTKATTSNVYILMINICSTLSWC